MKSSTVKTLKELFKDSVQLPVREDVYGTRCCELVEPDCADSMVRISGLPEEALVVKIDQFKPPDTIFAGHKGECKRADYVIFTEDGAKKRMLFVEMKKAKGKPEHHVIAQLKGAYCFVEYCKAIVKQFWGKPQFLEGFEPRYVSYIRTGSDRRKPKVNDNTPHNDAPEHMLKISNPSHQQYNKLVGA